MSHESDISSSRLSGISYALVAAALGVVLHLHPLSVPVSGMLGYTLVNAPSPRLQRLLPGTQAHWVLVALLSAAVVGLLSFAIAGGIAYLGSESGNPTILFERMGPVIERARAQLPAFVIDHLPSNAEQIRDAIMAWLSEHAGQLQLAGANAARVIVHLLIGMILGAMLALQMALAQSPGGPLTVVLKKRCENLVIAFHDIVFAQVKISALNTLFTGIFLLVVLPLFGVNVPLAQTLVLVSFMFSTEFQTFTQAIFGNVQARKEVDTVVDFYRGLLSRLPDDGGVARRALGDVVDGPTPPAEGQLKPNGGRGGQRAPKADAS